MLYAEMREVDVAAPSEVLVALRILVAWIDAKAPPLEDVKLLQQLKPELKYMPVDELACIVIEQQHRRN